VKAEDLQWNQLIDAFLFAERAIGISKSTYALYVLRLRIFRDFHLQTNRPCRSPLDCTPECIQSFFVYLTHNNRKLITVHAYYRELRTFFNWIREIGLRHDNLMDRIKPPKLESPLPRTVTEDHFLAVMNWSVGLLPNRKTFSRSLLWLSFELKLYRKKQWGWLSKAGGSRNYILEGITSGERRQYATGFGNVINGSEKPKSKTKVDN